MNVACISEALPEEGATTKDGVFEGSEHGDVEHVDGSENSGRDDGDEGGVADDESSDSEQHGPAAGEYDNHSTRVWEHAVGAWQRIWDPASPCWCTYTHLRQVWCNESDAAVLAETSDVEIGGLDEEHRHGVHETETRTCAFCEGKDFSPARVAEIYQHLSD